MRVLILFAHPALEKSRVHRVLLRHLPASPRITLHDLYETYPAFDIDVEREQALLLQHDVMIWQHPLYWYSTPAIVKQWEDLVLEHGWAYGSRGTSLRGKRWMHVITAGGREEAYRQGGHNRFTITELLAPLEQTARLCGMNFLPPYVIYGTHRMNDDEIEQTGRDYGRMIESLAGEEAG